MSVTDGSLKPSVCVVAGASVRMTVEATPERMAVEVIRTMTSDSFGVEEEVPPTASLVLQDD